LPAPLRLPHKQRLSMLRSLFRSCLVAAFALLAGLPRVEAFEGEHVVEVDGYPAMYKFIAGDPAKPLIVFIPGAHHYARIAYGGHEGGRAEDFLAHWLVELGYNFVGISYPLASKNPAMPGYFPAYTARDWGHQAADIARQVIDANHLTGRIIVIGWSMGGRIAEPVAEFAKADGLDLDLFISFSATPGVTGLVDMKAQFKKTPEGYADRSNIYGGFWRQIALESAMNGHAVIDEKSYLADYVGDMPVNLEGYGLHFRDGEFVRDYWADEDEFRVHDFAKLPSIAMLMPNETLDSRHALTDRGNWGLLVVNKVQADIDAAHIDVGKLPPERWLALVDLVRNAPDRLSLEMNGDHFFFLGEAGARETARAVQTLERRAHGFKAQLADILRQ
jgi:pimeloyl-ACP methyl ester carboxylesterase